MKLRCYLKGIALTAILTAAFMTLEYLERGYFAMGAEIILTPLMLLGVGMYAEEKYW